MPTRSYTPSIATPAQSFTYGFGSNDSYAGQFKREQIGTGLGGQYKGYNHRASDFGSYGLTRAKSTQGLTQYAGMPFK